MSVALVSEYEGQRTNFFGKNRTLEQPFKIPFIAAVVLVINTLKPDFAAETLKKASAAAQDAVNAGVWRDVKLLLRLLGCLQGLLEGDGVFVILEDLFSRAVDLQTSSSEDVGYKNLAQS